MRKMFFRHYMFDRNITMNYNKHLKKNNEEDFFEWPRSHNLVEAWKMGPIISLDHKTISPRRRDQECYAYP